MVLGDEEAYELVGTLPTVGRVALWPHLSTTTYKGPGDAPPPAQLRSGISRARCLPVLKRTTFRAGINSYSVKPTRQSHPKICTDIHFFALSAPKSALKHSA